MQEITIAPVSINVFGANKVERQMSVVTQASSSALTACLNMKGKVGTAIRSSAANAGLVDVVKHCATGNYKPLAEMLAIRTGEPIMISGRSTFEALPDIFAAKVAQAKLGKNGGMREDSKTGLLVPGAKLKSAIELHDFVGKVVDGVAKMVAERQAAKIEGGLRRAA